MKINRQAVTNLQGNHQKIVTKDSQMFVDVPELFSETFSTEEYPAYAYVPYNRSWGCVETIHEVPIKLMNNGLGVICKEKANPELLTAIYRCLGEGKVKNSKYSIIVFRVESREGMYFIDETSFSFYKKKLSILTPLKETVAQLPVTLFMAPEGQQWVAERNYIQYADNMRTVYQCSDGSVAHSYQEFKDWECELAYHPHAPVYPKYPECQETLSSIEYQESSEDGTIWRSQEMLEEYLSWKKDKNNGMKDGVYVGRYGMASNFIEYASIHNAAYYSNLGLDRQEQFYGAYNFLYSSSNQAMKSIDKLNSFQKVKK